MICFGEIGRRIVGKSVETVMRAPRGRDGLPMDIAAIVSSKFTFAVTMSEKSFRIRAKLFIAEWPQLRLSENPGIFVWPLWRPS